jgi:hypothetical protein
MTATLVFHDRPPARRSVFVNFSAERLCAGSGVVMHAITSPAPPDV